jgi:Xaa-Pro aminopeptidase
MPYARRVGSLRQRFGALQIDALVVSHLPNIRYLTGVQASAGILVVTLDNLYLVLDFRYAAAVARHLEEAALASMVSVRITEASLEEETGDILRERVPGRVGVEAAHVTLARHEGIQARLTSAASAAASAPASTNAELVLVRDAVEALRLVKDGEEVALLREAARRLSIVADVVIGEVVRVGRSEDEVAAEIDWRIRKAGFSEPAFETIVASGPNSALPHARPTSRLLVRDEPVLLDFGGVYNGYCVDLTRTVCIGRPPAEIARFHRAVAEAQQAALAAVRPGVQPEAVDAAARSVLNRHGLAEAFGHGTGHGLGLEVHEAPRLGRFREGRPASPPLMPGVVCTIEPGVYVPGIGGVRIEDDVLVTEEGCDVLTGTARDWVLSLT